MSDRASDHMPAPTGGLTAEEQCFIRTIKTFGGHCSRHDATSLCAIIDRLSAEIDRLKQELANAK